MKMSEEDNRKYVTVFVDENGHSDISTNMSGPEEVNWWLDVGKEILFVKAFTTGE